MNVSSVRKIWFVNLSSVGSAWVMFYIHLWCKESDPYNHQKWLHTHTCDYQRAYSCSLGIIPSPISSPNSIINLTSCLSEGRISDSSVHLQRHHLHIRGLGILGTSRRAVSSRSSHGTEARGGATHVGETWRSRHSRAPQEPAWCHQVPIALHVWEGVAWAAGAGAADVGASRRRRRCCFGPSHLEHHLKVWADRDKVKMLVRGTLSCWVY